jgi:hypothetical protein
MSEHEEEEIDEFWMRDIEKLNRKHAVELDELKSKLAATEVQRDAALDACREIKQITACRSNDTSICQDQLYRAFKKAGAALALTPERAVGVIDALKVFANPKNWHKATYDNLGKSFDVYTFDVTDPDDPCEFARQALEGPKGEARG